MDKLTWLIEVADRAPIADGAELADLRAEMVEFLGLPDGTWLDDSYLKKCTRAIKDGVTLLRKGEPWTILGHRFRISRENGLSFDQPREATNLQEALIETLVRGKNTLRRCKRRGCRNLFLKQRRQEYCSKKCSGLARTRRFRQRNPSGNTIRQS